MSVRVVIELFDGMPDTEACDKLRLQFLREIAANGGPLGDGVLDLGDGTNVIGARVIGVACRLNVPPPGDLEQVFIEPLETS